MRAFLRTVLHDSFRVGITMKGLDGLLETLAGLLLLVARPELLAHIVQSIGNSNWLWDVNGYIADHLLQASERLSTGGKMFAAVFLLAHGLAKVILVVGLWFDRLWAYPLSVSYTHLDVYKRQSPRRPSKPGTRRWVRESPRP